MPELGKREWNGSSVNSVACSQILENVKIINVSRRQMDIIKDTTIKNNLKPRASNSQVSSSFSNYEAQFSKPWYWSIRQGSGGCHEQIGLPYSYIAVSSIWSGSTLQVGFSKEPGVIRVYPTQEPSTLKSLHFSISIIVFKSSLQQIPFFSLGMGRGR